MPEIRVIVTGGRDYTDRAHIRTVLLGLGYLVTDPSEITIVHGAQRGLDRLAAEEAEALGYTVEPHVADWDKHGRAAGPIRNEGMAMVGADRCIAFPGGRGTDHMVRTAQAYGIPVQDERATPPA